MGAPNARSPAAADTAPEGPPVTRRMPAALGTSTTWIGSRPAWVHWGLIILMLLAAWALVWISGGTARAMPHLFYAPILISAFFFRWHGTLLTALAAALLCGPFIPLLTDPHTPQATGSWLLRAVFFLGIGALASVAMTARMRVEERAMTADVFEQLLRDNRQPVDTALVAVVEDVLRDQAFHIVFQPIYALQDGRLIGVEALTRFDAAPVRGPDQWFAAAQARGLGTDLEIATITRALDVGADLPTGIHLSVNVSPATLADPRLLELLRTRRREQVTVEITEHAVVEDYLLLRGVLDQLRTLGVRIAVDDAGAGVASLKHIVEIAPEAIKLDLSLTQNMAGSSLRRSLAAALVDFADHTDSQLIVEGIESAADVAAWRALGAYGVQGNYTGRPSKNRPALINARVVGARASGPRFPRPRRAG